MAISQGFALYDKSLYMFLIIKLELHPSKIIYLFFKMWGWGSFFPLCLAPTVPYTCGATNDLI